MITIVKQRDDLKLDNYNFSIGDDYYVVVIQIMNQLGFMKEPCMISHTDNIMI